MPNVAKMLGKTLNPLIIEGETPGAFSGDGNGKNQEESKKGKEKILI
jgi:hypothetical protein